MKKLPKFKPNQLVEVMWTDAFGNSCWEDRATLPNPPIIKSVGYFVRTTKLGIYIAMGIPISSDVGGDQVLAPGFIPHGVLLKARRVR